MDVKTPEIMFQFANPSFLTDIPDVVGKFGAEAFKKSLHNYAFMKKNDPDARIHIVPIPDMMYDDMMTFVNEGGNNIMDAYNKVVELLGQETVDQFVVKDPAIVSERINKFLVWAADEYFKKEIIQVTYTTIFGKWGQMRTHGQKVPTYPIKMAHVIYSTVQQNFMIIDQYLGPTTHYLTLMRRSETK